MNFTGTSGNDNINGTASADVFDLGQGGEDRARGQDGDDTFNMGATFDAGDRIDGGKDDDTVTLNGDYAAGLVFTATTMVNVERLVLAAGHNYALTTDDATVAGGKSLSVDASALGGARTLAFDGSAELDGTFQIVGGAGNDIITGGSLADTIDLSRGGFDTAYGGGGDDTFVLGSALDRRDTINGGAGNDTLLLDGDYSDGFYLSDNIMIYAERIVVAVGHDYDLELTTLNSHTVNTVDASALGAANFLRFEAAANQLDGFTVIGGAGNDRIVTSFHADTITPGAGNDTVISGGVGDTIDMGANFTAADRINGGGDATLLLNGDYAGGRAVVLAPNTMTAVGVVWLAAGHDYDLTFNPENFNPSEMFLLDASALHVGDSVSATLDATVNARFIGGAGDDTLHNAADADLSKGGDDTAMNCATITMGGALTAADRLSGHILLLDGNYGGAHKVVCDAATLSDFDEIHILGSACNLTFRDANVSAGFRTVINPFGVTGAFTFDGSAETDGSFEMVGGLGVNILKGGALSDTFHVGGGSGTTVYGGGGNDIIGSSIGGLVQPYFYDGGAGDDTLSFAGGGSTAFVDALKSIETVTAAGASAYNLTTIDANVAAGRTLTVDASALTSGANLTFDGSAETDGAFHLIGGLNHDILTGGAGSDSLQGGLGGDVLNGGGGGDTFVFTSYADSASTSYDNILIFDPAHDHLDLEVKVKFIDATITHGFLSPGTFDSDIAAVINQAVFGAHHAVLFIPDDGDLKGTAFVIVDDNGVAGYQGGLDYAIHVPVDVLTKALFI